MQELYRVEGQCEECGCRHESIEVSPIAFCENCGLETGRNVPVGEIVEVINKD